MRSLGLAVFACLLFFSTIRAAGPATGPAEQVRLYNQQLSGTSSGTRRDTAAGSADMLPLLRARAGSFLALIRTDPGHALSLALPAGSRAKLAALPGAADFLETSGAWTGLARTHIEDDFAAGRARTLHQLDTGTEMLELHYASAPPRTACAQTVEVQGVRLGNAVAASSVIVRSATGAAAASCTSTGDQRVAVVLLSFPSTPFPSGITASVVQNAFFGSGRSLDGFWREGSYGKTSASGAVFGPLMLDADYACIDTDNILKAGLAAAQGSLTFRDYTHIYLLFPKNGSCAIGTGSVGCWQEPSPQGTITSAFVWMPITSDLSQDELTALAVHEGGHNLGLEHSGALDYGADALGPPGAQGTFDEYGDRFSAMGITWAVNNTFGYGHYAAPQKAQLGWLQPNANVQTIESGGTFLIQPYETPSTGLQALKVRRGTGGASWLWLEYRQPAGNFDTNLRLFSQDAYSGAVIHFEDPADTAFPGYAKLLDFHAVKVPNDFSVAPLTEGQTWTDAYSNLSIRADSAGANGLSVTVSYSSHAGPQLAGSAMSAADGSTSIAPGSIVSLYGSGLASGLEVARGYPLPLVLGGTSVEIVDAGEVRTAPLYFVSSRQVNAQLPYDVGNPAQIRVRTSAGTTIALDVQFQTTAPTLFTADQSGRGTVAALHSPSYKPVSGTNPARPGEVIMVYASGLGPVAPPVAAGTAAGDGGAGGPLNTCTPPEAVQASIGGLDAKVLWAGLAPGYAGLYQINVQVPPGSGAGENVIVVQVGGNSSQPGVTVPVTQ